MQDDVFNHTSDTASFFSNDENAASLSHSYANENENENALHDSFTNKKLSATLPTPAKNTLISECPLRRRNIESQTFSYRRKQKEAEARILQVQLTNIHKPNDNDVLYGPGELANHHRGNQHYRSLVTNHTLQYATSLKPDKPKYSMMIYHAIRMQDPPGRFLRQDKQCGPWHDIGERKALQKTRHALRRAVIDTTKNGSLKNSGNFNLEKKSEPPPLTDNSFCTMHVYKNDQQTNQASIEHDKAQHQTILQKRSHTDARISQKNTFLRCSPDSQPHATQSNHTSFELYNTHPQHETEPNKASPSSLIFSEKSMTDTPVEIGTPAENAATEMSLSAVKTNCSKSSIVIGTNELTINCIEEDITLREYSDDMNRVNKRHKKSGVSRAQRSFIAENSTTTDRRISQGRGAIQDVSLIEQIAKAKLQTGVISLLNGQEGEKKQSISISEGNSMICDTCLGTGTLPIPSSIVHFGHIPNSSPISTPSVPFVIGSKRCLKDQQKNRLTDSDAEEDKSHEYERSLEKLKGGIPEMVKRIRDAEVKWAIEPDDRKSFIQRIEAIEKKVLEYRKVFHNSNAIFYYQEDQELWNSNKKDKNNCFEKLKHTEKKWGLSHPLSFTIKERVELVEESASRYSRRLDGFL